MPVGQRTGTCPFAACSQPAGAEKLSQMSGGGPGLLSSSQPAGGRGNVQTGGAAGWGWRELFGKPWLFLLSSFLPNTSGPCLRELLWGPACSSLVQVPSLALSCPWQLPSNPIPPGLAQIATAQPPALHAGDFWILPWEGEVS